ncbi:unnamed protein product [Schistosoma margrebowiei]|uniref:Reverse transcriptase domain-containing protein n=1 Tax=Schistosoma margrebowiei TaxID=48269 RepID=A0A183LJ34_9TREM|nr:unnamed protein product [Schistosoma margrebowiei]
MAFRTYAIKRLINCNSKQQQQQQDTNKQHQMNLKLIVLSNKFRAFHDLLNGEGTTVESNWKAIKEAITSICHEVLGHKKHHRKEWITVDTLDKIQERRNKKAAINTSRRRAEKAKAQAEYTEVNKQMKRSTRTDKGKYVEDLAMTVEKAAREGNMKDLYDTTKKFSENYLKPERPVKSNEDKVITSIKEQQHRSCTDQIATLWIIVEQSIEWNSSLYINCIDFEKAFDSVNRKILWKVFRHYGVPVKIVNIIRNFYDDLTNSSGVKTSIRQGCLLSPSLVPLVVDWIMRTPSSGGQHGIQWTSRIKLDDLNFTSGLAFLPHSHQQIQWKTTCVAAASATVGLNIHKGNSKILRCNTACTNPITIDGENLEDVKLFTYLGSIIDEHGVSDSDVKARIGKARAEYLQLKNI